MTAAPFPPDVAGALLGAAYATTLDKAVEWLNVAVARGLPPERAAELVESWTRANTPQVIGRG